jgi:hypothetical protein
MKRYSGKRGRGPAMMALKGVVWLALGALLVALVMMLWNWLMPSLFAGARVIDYWQTLGLIVLCRVLFGGGGGRRKGRRHHHHAMSDEEREQFKHRFKDRFKDRFNGKCGPQADAANTPGSPQ